MAAITELSLTPTSTRPIKTNKAGLVAQAYFQGRSEVKRKKNLEVKNAEDWTYKPSKVPNFVLSMSEPVATTPAALFKSEASFETQLLTDFKGKKNRLREFHASEETRLQKSFKALNSDLALPMGAQVPTILADTAPSTGEVGKISEIDRVKPLLDTVQSQYKDLRHRVQIDQNDALKQFNDARTLAAARPKKEKEKEKDLLVKELEDTKDIYVRFELLTLKLIEQSETDANELYSKIEGRTNEVETLNKLIYKINKPGELDLSGKEGEDLLKQVRGLVRDSGVEIPEGKTKWSEEEKKQLKENINMVKDSKEKFTQLERIKLQRHMQNISHHYQALSNNQKLRKEAFDTIIHNIRP